MLLAERFCYAACKPPCKLPVAALGLLSYCTGQTLTLLPHMAAKLQAAIACPSHRFRPGDGYPSMSRPRFGRTVRAQRK